MRANVISAMIITLTHTRESKRETEREREAETKQKRQHSLYTQHKGTALSVVLTSPEKLVVFSTAFTP